VANNSTDLAALRKDVQTLITRLTQKFV